MRIAAASGAGDVDTAARSFEAVDATGRIGSADKLRMIEAIAGGYYRAQRLRQGDAVEPALLQGRRHQRRDPHAADPEPVPGGDYAGAAKELTTEIQAAEKAGSAPAEDRLKLLMNAALKLNDNNAYVCALEQLVTLLPEEGVLGRPADAGCSASRISATGWRSTPTACRCATGSMTRPDDYMEMAQLALQASFPAEAKQVVDKGFASGVLGTGAEAERHKRCATWSPSSSPRTRRAGAEDERGAHERQGRQRAGRRSA